MNKEVEEWRDVPEYEGYYQVSDMGRVRSLDRVIKTKDGHECFYKGKVIEGSVNRGYRQTSLSKDNVIKTYKFSQLTAMAFLNHKPSGYKLVVDHINGNRSDDRSENLRIVTQRANLSTCFRSDEDSFSSTYVGVSWCEGRFKWRAQVKFNGRRIHLGYFTDELEASNAYQSALLKIRDDSFNSDDYKTTWTSKYKGVHFDKSKDKWKAYTTINGKQKHLGYFHTEIEAHHARMRAKEEQTPV